MFGLAAAFWRRFVCNNWRRLVQILGNTNTHEMISDFLAAQKNVPSNKAADKTVCTLCDELDSSLHNSPKETPHRSGAFDSAN